MNFYLLGKVLLLRIKVKKLLIKDNKSRLKISKNEIQYLILKSIFKNQNYFFLIRWNAFLKLDNLLLNNHKISVSNRCLATLNKKRFNKLTNFSRHIFLKLIRSGQIHGMKKSSW